MKAIIKTKTSDHEIKLTVGSPFNQIPADEEICQFVFNVKEEPVFVTLVGDNPYSESADYTPNCVLCEWGEAFDMPDGDNPDVNVPFMICKAQGMETAEGLYGEAQCLKIYRPKQIE